MSERSSDSARATVSRASPSTRAAYDPLKSSTASRTIAEHTWLLRPQCGPAIAVSVPQGPPPMLSARTTGSPSIVSVGYHLAIRSVERPM